MDNDQLLSVPPTAAECVLFNMYIYIIAQIVGCVGAVARDGQRFERVNKQDSPDGSQTKSQESAAGAEGLARLRP